MNILHGKTSPAKICVCEVAIMYLKFLLTLKMFLTFHLPNNVRTHTRFYMPTLRCAAVRVGNYIFHVA